MNAVHQRYAALLEGELIYAALDVKFFGGPEGLRQELAERFNNALWNLGLVDVLMNVVREWETTESVK